MFSLYLLLVQCKFLLVFRHERPMLGESPKAYFFCKVRILGMKSGGFHEIWQISPEIWQIPCLKPFKSDNSRKTLHFQRVLGEGYVI